MRSLLPLISDMPKYLISSTQIRGIEEARIGAQRREQRGPILKQQDLEALICKSKLLKIEAHLFTRD